MSDTKRRRAFNLFRRERKPFRKRHWRAFRHSTTTAMWMVTSRGTADVLLPSYRKTQGWLTW